MKLLFLILALTFSQMISAQYSDVPASEYDHDVQIQAALYYGAWDTVAGGIKSGRLPPSTFEVTQITRVQRQLVAGFNFQFDVVLSDGQVTASANYVVYSEAGTSNLEVTSSTFDITSASNELPPLGILPPQVGGGIPGGWSPVDVTTLNADSNLRDILSFGVQNTIVQGIDEGNLPDANYYIEDVRSIDQQVVNGLNYNFSVVLGDDQGGETVVNFTVYDQPRTGQREFKNYVVVGPQGPPLLGGWTSVPVGNLDTDQDLFDIFTYGVGQVIDEATANGLLSGDYQPVEIYSIKQQLVNGMNYRFNVELENDENGSATVIFVVYVTRDGSRSLSSYLFLDVQDSESEETTYEPQGGAPIDGGAFD